ncbi:MAG TPA: wax ester/triacylglycerol synthase family O-acyltransferase [Solirubrobacterales bacterium]|nr:wax ester/triacylglycerol synthase family O-acyltransferase [Solirubrobacterales bacterium]
MRSHLSPLDAALLEIEEADDGAHMQIGCAMVFDPLPGGERPSLERLREQARQRLGEASVLRRRLSMPRVGRDAFPVWLPDPDFDVGELIRRASLPDPGGEEELAEWLGDHFSHRLDRSRPLWEVTLLEGLEDGRWALVFKVHHCLIDGVSGVTIVAAMLDTEPEPEPGSTPLLDLISLLGEESERGVLIRRRGAVGEAEGGGIDAAVHPRRVTSLHAQSRAMAEMLARNELTPAPPTSLNRRIGATRRVATVEVPTESLSRVEEELGGTVNDVALAAVAGGLRRLFESRGEDVDHVRAMVPLSLRLQYAGEALLSGSRVSSLFVDLVLSEPDPLLRYRKIVAAASAMHNGGATGSGSAIELVGLAPPLVQSVVARLTFTPRLFNLNVVAFPPFPITLYSLGATMCRAIPLVPIFSGHALGIAVGSYDGTTTFGLGADRDAVPDLAVLQAGIEASLTELGDLTGAQVA